MNRRDFIKTAGAMAAIGALGANVQATFAQEKKWKTTLYKALITGNPNEATLAAWKAAGIQGAEAQNWQVGEEKAAEFRAGAEKLGMKIHSVMRGWTNFNKPDALENDMESVRQAIRSAKGFGADAVLLVPCTLSGVKTPNAWDFKYEFDPDTMMVSKVVAGGDAENVPYEKYIEGHNYATKVTLEALDKLIPFAEENGVVIALENVWNNLWVMPDISAALVRKVNNPWVRFYLDLGNHVKYASTTDWLKAFKEGEIAKMHVKGFKLNENGQDGTWVNSREASIDWPAVRQLIDDLNYSGWLSVEEGGSPEFHNATLDMIIAGKSSVE